MKSFRVSALVAVTRRLATVSAIASLPAAALLVPGCSSQPGGDRVGETSQSLGVLVHLPKKLGGGDRTTDFAPNHQPKRLYPTGLPVRAPEVTPKTRTMKAQGVKPAAGSVDLSQYAPNPGNQGQTGSCATWATGYSAMGWWAAKAGLPDAPYAPMYLYSQQVHGACDQGTMISDNMDILQQQGIDTDADYQPMQRDLDCATEPNDQQRQNAGKYRISAYQQLDLSSDPRQAIEQTLTAGYPVVLGIYVYNSLMNANAQNYLIPAPAPGEQALGGHAITAFKYDDNGVWILNSWDTTWGLNGWGELSWDFITGSGSSGANLMDAEAITGVVGGGGATPTPAPSPSPTPGTISVGFDSPANGSTAHPGDAVTIQVTASPSGTQVTSAELVWQGPAGRSTFTLQSQGKDQWGISLNLSAQAATGARTLTVNLTDAAGETATSTESITVQ